MDDITLFVDREGTRDTAAQVMTEREVVAARTAAEEANVAISNFIASMSHELRTPLSAIIGHSEMLQEEIAEGVQASDHLIDVGKVESNARHLLGLIDDMLDLITRLAERDSLGLPGAAVI